MQRVSARDHYQWTMLIQPPTIDRSLRGEGVRRCGHEYVVVRERDRGAMRGMKARLFDHPCHPTVAAGAESDCGGGHHGARTVRVPGTSGPAADKHRYRTPVVVKPRGKLGAFVGLMVRKRLRPFVLRRADSGSQHHDGICRPGWKGLLRIPDLQRTR